jgi:hypothetical protein
MSADAVVAIGRSIVSFASRECRAAMPTGVYAQNGTPQVIRDEVVPSIEHWLSVVCDRKVARAGVPLKAFGKP